MNTSPAPEPYLEKLKTGISSAEVVIGVVGLGYVGLPLVIAFSNAGLPVIGFDIDEKKIASLKNGKSYIKHIDSKTIEKHVAMPKNAFHADFSFIKGCDVIILCVPTPLSKHMAPDLSYVTNTTKAVAEYMRPGQLLILESTTYPGTTREVLLPLIEASTKMVPDEEFFLAYSPEREDPGNPSFVTRTIPKVVGSDHPQTLETTISLYEKIVDKVVPVSTTATAEAVKLTENIFRAVNIALVNELKTIYAPMGIDIWEVISAASTKPFGFMPFYPGPGLGGHCIPIDPFYLSWKAKEYGLTARFIELAGEVNRRMPDYVIANLVRALSEKSAKAINGARILIIGLAYKKNVDDMRESPSLELMRKLETMGAKVNYYDQNIPVISQTREYSDLAGKQSVALSASEIASYDGVLIVTDHSDTDWKLIADHGKIVIDTRNVMTQVEGAGSGNIFKS